MPDSNTTGASRLTHVTTTRVRYGETDQMGVVYHANHIVYFELGRTELIRSNGISYAELEEQGTRLVVVEVGVKYRNAAHYDDELRVETRVTKATGVTLRFDYVLTRASDDQLIAEGHTVLCSLDESGRPCRLPEALRQLLR